MKSIERIKILIVTSEYPTPSRKNDVPWLVEQVEYVKNNGIDVTVFKIPNQHLIKRLKAIFNLQLLIRNGKFSLIHCHWGYNTVFAYSSKTPIITTFHGSDIQGHVKGNGTITLKGKLMMLVSRISASLSSVNIFVSSRLTKNIPKKVLNRSFIIPMGYNSNLFKPSSKSKARFQLGLDQNVKYMLFAGNYSKSVKGFPLAIKVINSLDESYELIKLDYASHKEMVNYMNASDVLLMTSYQEGAPVIIKEALACNLPVISTDVGDVKEVIKYIPDSYVIKRRDPIKIATLIKRSIEMGSTNVGSKIMRKYTAKRMNNRVLGIYLDILQNERKFID